ncbi:hypothetical protein HDE_12002 [Halotydeus destructor]|nr:hypothetical protein HDE_12002 [Halotydeus destructor]
MSFGLNGDNLNRIQGAIRRPKTEFSNSLQTNDNALQPSVSSMGSNFNQNLVNKSDYLFDDSIDDRNANTNQNVTAFQPSEPFKLLETLELSVSNGNFDPQLIYDVCNYLKANGCFIDESPYKDQFDLYFNTLRNVTRDNRIDSLSRSRLLEVIELRAMNWISSEELSSFYARKLSELESLATAFNLSSNLSSLDLTLSPSLASFRASSPTNLATAEFIRPSGKYNKPSKVPGKSFVKDEFVIRNSDSGKVMGIKGRRVHLIEELSDTVISFQRVNPGAKERLLQITGPNDDSISRAKCYIEDTIRRNASPVPFDQPSASFSSATPYTQGSNILSRSSSSVVDNSSYHAGEAFGGNLPHVKAVYVASDVVVVSSNKSNLADQAKVVLDQYFNGNNRSQGTPTHGTRHRKSVGYEASESSDSEIYSNTSRHDQSMSMAPLYGKSGVAANTLLQNVKQSSLNYNLSRQSSFHTGIPCNPSLKSVREDPERGALWRSASQGSFLSGRTLVGQNASTESEMKERIQFVEDQDEAFAITTTELSDMRLAYEREFLMKCSRLPASLDHPAGFDRMKDVMPDIVKNPDEED